MNLFRVIPLAAVACGFLTGPLRADTLFFRSSSNSLWSSVTNWYLSDGMGGYIPAGRLPNAPDTVILQNGPDGQAGVFQVNTMILEGVGVANGAYSAQTIQLGAGSSFTGSTVTVQGQMEVLAGGPACVFSGANVIIDGGAELFLTNGAALTLEANALIYDEGAVILTDTSEISSYGGTNTLDILPGAQLESSGTALVLGGPGVFTLNNNGKVVCNSGTLELSPGTIISTNGTAKFQTVASTATLFLDPPTVGPGITFIFTGPGTNSVSGATVQGTMQVGAVDSGTGLFVPGNLFLLSASQISGPGAIHVLASNNVPSSLNAINSIFNATTINIDPGALFNITDAAQFISNVVNTAGSTVWTSTFGDPITLSGSATFNNLPGATFVAANNDAGIVQAAEPRVSVFNNSGTFRIASGTNTMTLGDFSMAFNNNGLMDVLGGSVGLGYGTNSGQFNLAAGTMLSFNGPTNALNQGASFTGTGSIQINGSTLIVNGNVIMPNLALGGFSAIDGPGQLTVTGAFAWNGGTLQGSGSLNIASGGTMTIASGLVVLTQRTINNSGTVNWTGPNISVGNGAVINNLSGALFNIQTSAEFQNGGEPIAIFNNFGTVQKSSGSTTTFFLNFINSGLFQVLTQKVNFPDSFQQNAGSTVVSSNATLEGTGISLLGGTLGGAGTISAPVTNSAVVSPGMSPGILTITSGYSYTQSVAGILNIELGGLTVGSQYDQLAATGCPVNLNGSLNISLANGFVPVAGQRFTILTCASRTGTFPVLTGNFPGGGLELVPVYSSTNVVLVVSNVSVLRPLLTQVRTGSQGNNFQLTWPSVIGQPYQVEYSSNLYQWFVLSNLTASATNSSVIDPTPIPGIPKRFYRLR